MAKENLTIFQRLGRVLDPNYTQPTQKQPTQRYNVGNGELLKTTSKDWVVFQRFFFIMN
jgi:hypothetical protein